MNWKWFLTPAEPKALYAFFVGVGAFATLFLTMPVWQDNPLVLVVTAGVSAFVFAVLAKIIMQKGIK